MSGRDYHNYHRDITEMFGRAEGKFLMTVTSLDKLSLKIEHWRGMGWRISMCRGEHEEGRWISPRLDSPKMLEWLSGFEEALDIIWLEARTKRSRSR